MVTINTEIKGLRELAQDVKALETRVLRSTLRTALRNAVAPVRTEARKRIRPLSRRVARSVKSVSKVSRPGFGRGRVGFDRSVAIHGGFLELGTERIDARPYLVPAFEDLEQDGTIQNAFIEALNKTIEKRLAKNRGLR